MQFNTQIFTKLPWRDRQVWNPESAEGSMSSPERALGRYFRKHRAAGRFDSQTLIGPLLETQPPNTFLFICLLSIYSKVVVMTKISSNRLCPHCKVLLRTEILAQKYSEI